MADSCFTAFLRKHHRFALPFLTKPKHEAHTFWASEQSSSTLSSSLRYNTDT